ncbi:hypothetical protein [Nocardia sp. XZ_19_385]|uniref:hypothetical protein n=1 Tax=Nocardia sp. XZ_19_385 TaxID=2769488 RepID=UPI00188EB140|nr:hypothetical protein [Nocardia sp. XZ_19_385]
MIRSELEYRLPWKRVAAYARPTGVARATIESAAFRSGTPEHRPDRDAAFDVSVATGAPGKRDEIVGAQGNTDSGIDRPIRETYKSQESHARRNSR